MKFFYSLLLFFAVCQPVFAQKNFQPGYIITLQGDTIRGTVDTREWHKNPKSINFKNSSGRVETYTVLNAAGFGIVNDADYSRYITQISIDDILPEKLNIKPKYTTDTLFLRKIVSGKHLTMYDYTDALKTRYIIVDKHDGAAHELEYHILADSLTSNEVIKTTAYRHQLTYYTNLYAAGNADIQRRINNAGYNDNLVQIVSLINGGDTKDAINSKKGGFRFFAGASVNSNSLTYSGAAIHSGSPFTFVSFNLGLDAFQNTKIGKNIFRIEASFAPYHSIDELGSILSTTPANSNATRQQQTLTLSPQFVYNVYNQPNIKAFFSAGANVNYSNYKNSDGVIADYFSMSDFWFNFPVGAGATFADKLQLQLTYFTPASIVYYPGLKGSLATFGVGVNYLFTIKQRTVTR